MWLLFSQLAKQDQQKVLSNVELMINVRPTPVHVGGGSRPSTWNFLKMALPSAHREAPMEIHTPRVEPRHQMAREHMLNQNNSKLQRSLELEAEKNLGHHQASLETLNAASVSHTRAHPAEIGRLEEIGTRRASRSAIALDNALIESHSSGARAQELSALAAAGAPSHSHSVAPMATLSDNSAPAPSSHEGGSLSALSNLLPNDEGISSHGRSGPMGVGGGDMEAAPAPVRHQTEAIIEHKKKTSMIEGPLKKRRVLHYEIPAFPKWAQQQGILEAIVRIRFSVAPSGEVIEDGMHMVQTSGYPELDRLAMDSLKQWRFQAKSDDSGNEWGIITFRFVLE
jgi:TonB family protein